MKIRLLRVLLFFLRALQVSGQTDGRGYNPSGVATGFRLRHQVRVEPGVHPEGRRERRECRAWFCLDVPDVVKRVPSRGRKDDVAKAVGDAELHFGKVFLPDDVTAAHFQVRHEFRKRDDLVPDFRAVGVAVDDLARAKPEELGLEVFAHSETILPYGLAVNPDGEMAARSPSGFCCSPWFS